MTRWLSCGTSNSSVSASTTCCTSLDEPTSLTCRTGRSSVDGCALAEHFEAAVHVRTDGQGIEYGLEVLDDSGGLLTLDAGGAGTAQ